MLHFIWIFACAAGFTALNDVLRSIDWTRTNTVMLLPHGEVYTKESVIEKEGPVDEGAVETFLQICLSLLSACDTRAAIQLRRLFPDLKEMFPAVGPLTWFNSLVEANVEASGGEQKSDEPRRRQSLDFEKSPGAICGDSLRAVITTLDPKSMVNVEPAKSLPRVLRNCINRSCRGVEDHDLILHAYMMATAHRSFQKAAADVDREPKPNREYHIRARSAPIYSSIFKRLYGSILMRRGAPDTSLSPLKLLAMWRPTTLDDYSALSKVLECIYKTEDLHRIASNDGIGATYLYEYLDCAMLHDQLMAGTLWMYTLAPEVSMTSPNALDVFLDPPTSDTGSQQQIAHEDNAIYKRLAEMTFHRTPRVAFDIFVTIRMRNFFWTNLLGNSMTANIVLDELLAHGNTMSRAHPRKHLIGTNKLLWVCHMLRYMNWSQQSVSSRCAFIFQEAERLIETASDRKNHDLEKIRFCARHDKYGQCPTVPTAHIVSERWPPASDQDLARFKSNHKNLEAALLMNAAIAHTSNFPERYYHQKISSVYEEYSASEICRKLRVMMRTSPNLKFEYQLEAPVLATYSICISDSISDTYIQSRIDEAIRTF